MKTIIWKCEHKYDSVREHPSDPNCNFTTESLTAAAIHIRDTGHLVKGYV